MAVELSYCVVNTEQRQLLRYCLDSIARERAAVPFETEVIVLDNASRDGSAGTARAHGATTEVVALEQRRGKGENDSTLLRRARGRFVLLLNDDAELEPAAAHWDPDLGSYVLEWSDFIAAPDPHAAGLAFARSAFRHACIVCEWDPDLPASAHGDPPPVS